jgi:SAM-dependent methyltransferase
LAAIPRPPHDPAAPLLGSGAPSPWVVRFLAGAPAGRPVLDLACGGGRHARHAANLGFDVVAVDRRPEIIAALADVARAKTRIFDLEAGLPWPFGGGYGAVIVTHYLHRPLFPDLIAALSPDGVLIYETFVAGHERYRRPSNPDFLLRPNELLPPVIAAKLVVVAFEQGERPAGACGGPGGGQSGGIVQRLAAVGPAHPWAFAHPRSLDA